jgi:mannose-6-phosphate isomerase-like protein (cupin superfamily)
MELHDLSKSAIDQMVQVDLASLSEPPTSPIEEFRFNALTCGIGAFVGRPPWECHTRGDELLHVLAGRTKLTLIGDGGLQDQRLEAGSLVVVPRGCWHRNSAPEGVTVLYITPTEGNLHSWAEGDPRHEAGP